jgi:hypothetical protein
MCKYVALISTYWLKMLSVIMSLLNFNLQNDNHFVLSLLHLLAVVKYGIGDFVGKTGCPIEAVPFGVCGRAGVPLEDDVRPLGGRTWSPWPWSRP